jgi:hypothetical protein
LETGVAWPNPRFTDNRNGTITDNLTGLIWLKNANCAGELKWADALHVSNVLEHGTCGLTDGSSPGDWRLPTRFELESLLSMAYYDPAIPNTAGTGKWTAGDPFVNVPSYWYWTSTTNAFNSENAWFVNTAEGRIYYDSKQYFLFVWPVRGKQSERRADCNSDLKVDLADLVIMKGEFFKTDCVENPCLADCNGDNKVDLADLVLMKEQFFTVSGQSQASSYEIDVGQDGTFDTGGTINLDNNDSVTIDIYVSGYTCPPNDKLFGSQLYILVDESQVTVSGFPYDTSHAGPFDPGLSVFAWEEKNVYILVSSNFNYVTVIGGKQKLGTVKLTCKAPGSFNLVVANDLTSYGYPASDDGISVDCNLAMIYPKTAVLTVNQGNIPTVFPEDPTVCVVTTCPEEVTVCPETPTECPVDPTFCPADPTFCPVDPTFCPGIPTECPADPTVCVVTECPADPTFCPADPTFCPADPTFCPETPTECPSDPTSCPGIPTECPVDPTVCVATACPVDPTFCPVIPTQCPVPTTTTTQPWYPDCIDFDPDTLNINSRGKWITVYIEPPGYDPAEIDPATILLNGTVSPILDPKYDFVTDKDLYLADVTCEPGVIERMVKFDSGAVAEILSVGEEVEIVVTYGLYDGTLFMGTYVIRVIDR